MKTNEKATVTPIGTVLQDTDLQSFKDAVSLWKSKTKDTLGALEVMAKIGNVINLVYEKGEALKLTRSELSTLVTTHFVGLNRRERYDFKVIAKNFEAIKEHTKNNKIKSLNPTYLLNSWKKAEAEKTKQLEAEKTKQLGAEKIAAGTVDIQGNYITEVTPKEAFEELFADDNNLLKNALNEQDEKEHIVFSDTKIKKGYDNIVRPNPLTAQEIVSNVGAATNQAITYFNEGKLTPEDITKLEQYLTKTLQHINKVELNTNEQELKQA